ncbi:MAG: hypothetical protein V8T35_06975 [Prevotella sp.]
MRKSFKNMGKEGFIAFLNKTKTSKYYIPFNIRLSCIFSAFYKICLYYLCYERLCYLHGKRQERKKWFFQELLAESSTRGYENVPPMALFTPTEG